MKRKNGLHAIRMAPRAAGFALATVLPLAVSTASAFEMNLGAVKGSLDTTLSYGTGWRMEEADKKLSAQYPNYPAAVLDNRRIFLNKNDGDANFDNNHKPISSTFKITSDLELKWNDFGAFVRGTAFYDTVLSDERPSRGYYPIYPNSASCNPQSVANVNGCGFPSELDDKVANNARVLDAYVYGNFEIGGRALNVRLGEQVINWGEALFLQDGINNANPVSLSQLRLPGAEVKEALLPLPMLYASLELADNLTMEAFYEFDWDYSEADGVGSYYSTDDAFAGDGANRILVSLEGSVGPEPLARAYNQATYGVNSPVLTHKRVADKPVDSDGQFGVAFRYNMADTELGLFFMNYHSHKPVAQATTGRAGALTGTPLATALATAAVTAQCPGLVPVPFPTLAACQAAVAAQTVGGLNAMAYLDSTTYQIVYPEDIQMVGLSFSTTFGDLSVSGELAYRPNDVILSELGDNLVAYNSLNAGVVANGGTATFGDILNNGQPVGAGQTVKVWEELETWNLDLVTIYNFGPTLGANVMTGVLEFGASYVPKGEDKRYASTASLLYIPASEVTGGLGNPSCNAPKYDATTCLSEGGRDSYLDELSMGYRVVLTSTYNDVFAGVALSPVIRFAHDFEGNSHRTGNFLENRKSGLVGLNAIYNNAFEVGVAYNAFWGAKASNLLHDRDNMTLTLKYSF